MEGGGHTTCYKLNRDNVAQEEFQSNFITLSSTYNKYYIMASPILLILLPTISCYTPQITSLQSFFSHLALASGQHPTLYLPEKRSPDTTTQDPRLGRAISLFAPSRSSIHEELYDKFQHEDPPPQTTPSSTSPATTESDIKAPTDTLEDGSDAVDGSDAGDADKLECTHKVVKQCHYTFKTYFKAVQEKVCHENYEKLCSISFSPRAAREKVSKCYQAVSKQCNGEGPEVCKTWYETECSRKYRNDISLPVECQKVPVEICGKGCEVVEGPEECHEEENNVVVDTPEESCDLSPWKQCQLVTRLVPSLKPLKECTAVPMEVCNLEHGNKKKYTEMIKVSKTE